MSEKHRPARDKAKIHDSGLVAGSLLPLLQEAMETTPYCLLVVLFLFLEVGAGNRSVKCLLYKHKDLRWILGTNVKLDMVAHTCNPSSREAERWIPAAHWSARLDCFMSSKPMSLENSENKLDGS